MCGASAFDSRAFHRKEVAKAVTFKFGGLWSWECLRLIHSTLGMWAAGEIVRFLFPRVGACLHGVGVCVCARACMRLNS